MMGTTSTIDWVSEKMCRRNSNYQTCMILGMRSTYLSVRNHWITVERLVSFSVIRLFVLQE